MLSLPWKRHDMLCMHLTHFAGTHQHYHRLWNVISTSIQQQIVIEALTVRMILIT